MDPSFWHQKWARNEIAFHGREANPLLVTYFETLSLPQGSRVFLPFCGKTLDIRWLLSRGYRVAGAELSEIAVEQLFLELGVAPQISVIGQINRYSADGIDIFVGDFFTLSHQVLGSIDAIYDRAALVALPEVMRARYAAHLTAITQEAVQLLITYVYDQALLGGPPFSVRHEEVVQHYQQNYTLQLLASVEIRGGLKGKCAAAEHVWLLRKPAQAGGLGSVPVSE